MGDLIRLILRVVLGGLFIFSGVMKLRDPGMFAFAVKGFRLGVPEHIVIVLAFAIPWIEVLAGLGLVFGLGTRASAVVIAGMMAGFIAGIISLLQRHLDVNCPCFGSFELVCTGPMGVCHIVRNSVIGSIAMGLLIAGGGRFAADRVLRRRPAAAPQSPR